MKHRIRTGVLLVAGVTVLAVFVLFVAGLRLLSVTGSDMRQLERTSAVSSALGTRVDQLSGWVRTVRRWVDSGPPAPALAALRDSIQVGPGRAAPQAFADVAPAMRSSVASVNLEAAQLERQLASVVANLELGRRAAAARQLAIAESLQTRVTERVEETQILGLEDLLQSRAEFQSTARRAALLFALAGFLLIASAVGFVVFFGRRVLAPLGQLDRALSRVEAGDLRASVPAARDDEMGRLLSHFNRVTTVLRERAEQQGRLAAAGELVASVAHEVNNPLQAIGLTAEGMLTLEGLPREARADAEQILRQSERAGVLVRGFLRFVKPRHGESAQADVNAVVQEAMDLLHYQFGVHEVAVEFVPEATRPVARCTPSGVEQVVVNLLANAIQALAGAPGERRVRVTTRLAGTDVQIDVCDSGPGVPAAEREQLFRPFHTTKGEDGTGLGLYISREIARAAGGDLVLVPGGRGATFRLSLPRAAAGPVPEPAATPETRRDALSGVRVLVVDDDDAVRTPMVRGLRAVGADVREARSGREALLRLDGASPDAIVLDLRMPELSGNEVLSRLQADRPDLVGRIIVVSGDLHELRAVRLPPDRLVAKPVALDQLIERIDRLVSEAGAAPTP